MTKKDTEESEDEECKECSSCRLPQLFIEKNGLPVCPEGKSRVRHVIWCFGKGGVGKSTVSVNLDMHFPAMGSGWLLDLDMHGPIFPKCWE